MSVKRRRGASVVRTSVISALESVQIATVESLERRCLFSYGNLDPTFGTANSAFGGGTGTVNFNGAFATASATALQADGKIVTVGSVASGTSAGSDFAISRLTTAGTADTTFGKSGVVETDLGGQDAATSVVIQPDGKIVVGGYSVVNPALPQSDFALVRYNADGTLDSTFGTGGKVVLNLDPYGTDTINGLALQSDAKIVAVGESQPSAGTARSVVFRFSQNGTLDTTFGASSTGYVFTAISGGVSQANNVVVLPSSTILVLGQALSSGGQPSIALTEYTAAGALSSSFGTNGSVVEGVAGETSAHALAVGANGEIYVATTVQDGSSNFTNLYSYDAAGVPESQFNGDVGVSIAGGAGPISPVGLAVQDDGSVLVAATDGNGGYANGGSGAGAWVVQKISADGAPDASFGNDGQAYVLPGYAATAAAVTIQNDGNLIVSGTVAAVPGSSSPAGTIVVARLSNGPATSIAGHVYFDPTGSGQYASGDAPLTGWALNVYADGGNTLLETITTDASGAFNTGPLFVNDPIVEATVPGYCYVTENTASQFGAPGTSAPVANAVVLIAGTQPVATIRGSVFTDENGDGSQTLYYDGPLPGITVYADLNHNGKLDTGEPSAVSNGNGLYQLSIPATAAGDVTVAESLPSGALDTTGNAGGETVYVDAGATLTGPSFGVFSPITVTGTVFNDANANGERDLSETGVAGVRVYLDSNYDGVYESNEPSTLTDANGNYTLTGIGPTDAGTPYDTDTASIVAPAGYIAESGGAGFTPSSGARYDLDFEVIHQSYVTGGVELLLSNGSSTSAGGGITVYADLNNDGVLDAGDVSTTTNGNGGFSFVGLPTGNDTIRYVLPSGYTPATGRSTSFTATVGTLTRSFGAFYISSTTSPAPGGIEGRALNVVAGSSPASYLPAVGRTIYLDTNDNGKLDPGELSTTTSTSGDWYFSGLGVGTYVVREVVPAGYSETDAYAATGLQVTLTVYTPNYVPTMSVSPFTTAVSSGSISGTVFDDVNGDGIQDDGEAGLSGRTIFLDLNGDGVFDTGDLSTTTTATGAYTLSGVPAGTYSLYQVLPSGYTQTAPSTGTNGGANRVTLTAGQQVTGENFGEEPPSGGVYGLAFDDVNGDGSQNGAGDYSLTGRSVYIDSNNDGVLDDNEPVLVTNANGFSFGDLPLGTYTFRQVLPAGWQQTAPAAGAGITVNVTAGSFTRILFGSDDPTPTANAGSSYTVPGGGSVTLSAAASTETGGTLVEYEWDLNYNGTTFHPTAKGVTTSFSAAGLTGPSQRTVAVRVTDAGGNTAIATAVVTITAAAPTGGSVAGIVTNGGVGETVYLDANNNSKLDTGELSTTTTATGAYSFTNVPAGAYIIRQVLPSGYTQTSPSGGLGIHITVTSGGSLSGENFTDKAPVTAGSIAGTVSGGVVGQTIYLDANNNGVLDNTELHTTTGSGGAYSFTGVPIGSYVIRQVVPGGYAQTSPAGGAGIALTVAAGSAFTGGNFTDAVTSTGGSIAGTVTGGLVGETVYLDANNDSKQESGELSTTTGTGGVYLFTAVPAGAYVVRQVLPTGYTQTSPSSGLGIHITVTSTSKLTNENFTDTAPLTGGTVTGKVTTSAGAAVAGVTVYLDVNNNAKPDSGELSTVTLSDGTFSFTNVPAGAYVVRQVLPTGDTQTSPSSGYGIHITVAAGKTLAGNNFTDTAPAGGAKAVLNAVAATPFSDGSAVLLTTAATDQLFFQQV